MKEIVTQNSFPASEQPRVLLEEEEATDLREYWFVVYRHRRAALAFLLLTIFLAAIAIRWEGALYTAKTTLYVPSQNRGVLDNPEPIAAGTNPYETQRKLLTSRSLIAKVIKTLTPEQAQYFSQRPVSILSWGTAQLKQGLRSVVGWAEETPLVQGILQALGVAPKETPQAPQFEFGVHPAWIDRYVELLKVTASPESQLIDVEVSSSSAALAKEVANSHVATFIKNTLVTRFELTSETREFLEKKLAELKLNVEYSERALNSFQKNHQIVSIDKGSSLLLDQLKKLNIDLTEARSKRIELESLHRLVQKRDNQLLSQVIDNPTIQALRKQITALEVQDAHLGTKFKPTYRGRMAVQQELDEAKGRLDQEINRVVSTIEKDYGAARAKEQALTGETDQARRVALDLQEKAVDYAVLEREVVSNRALYEAVFKKTKEAALTGEDPIPNLRVVDRAEIPLVPGMPTWVRSLLLGVAVGLFGGIGLAFLLHLLDNTLKTPEEVVRFLRLPLLGFVPDVGKLVAANSYGLGYAKTLPPPPVASLALQKKDGNDQLMISHHPLSLMGEMYRSICTAILFSKAEKPPRSILITSSQPNEGKTVSAINISSMLAQSGGRVLLIDADLHGGRCHKLLGVGNGNGLSNVLAGTEDSTRLIKKTKINNLHLLSRGTLPPNPAALLGSDKMRQTLDGLAAGFRFIVLDSPPLLPVSDTVHLSTMVDGVILVTRGTDVPRDLVRRARDRLEYVEAKILGVVLNGIDIMSAEYAQYRQVYRRYYANYVEEPRSSMQTILTKHDPNTASAEFLDYIIARLTEVIGPIAPVIVYEEINALGESADAFPQSRIEELIEAVTGEIPDGRLKVSFRERFSDWVRSNELS